MSNVTFIKVEQMGEITEHAIIDHGNEEYTSMPKELYDKQQAEQSTPIVIDEAETK